MKLQDKVAIVTGGARGIGKALARRFAREGAICFIADILEIATQQTVEDIRKSDGKAFPVHLDVTKTSSIGKMIHDVVAAAGRIDVLVNAAAVLELQPMLSIEEETWDRIFAVNTKGLFFTLQAVAKQMIAQGGGGKIVNFASEAAQRAGNMVVAYSATKAAVMRITACAGLELAKHKINVNAISPGSVMTEMWEEVDKLCQKWSGTKPGQITEDAKRAIPYGRMGLPEDYEGIGVFLACGDSDYIVGQTFNVDGGKVM